MLVRKVTLQEFKKCFRENLYSDEGYEVLYNLVNLNDDDDLNLIDTEKIEKEYAEYSTVGFIYSLYDEVEIDEMLEELEEENINDISFEKLFDYVSNQGNFEISQVSENKLIAYA